MTFSEPQLVQLVYSLQVFLEDAPSGRYNMIAEQSERPTSESNARLCTFIGKLPQDVSLGQHALIALQL